MKTKVNFYIVERSCKDNNTGLEFALFCKFDSRSGWCICSWDKKPKEKDIIFAKELFMRSCEVYHRHINFPKYN
jgi:hypothetical protein